MSKMRKEVVSKREKIVEITSFQLKHIIMYLQEKPEVRGIFSEYTKLVKLLLTIPGSSCTNERSFSTLRRLKSYLRNLNNAFYNAPEKI